MAAPSDQDSADADTVSLNPAATIPQFRTPKQTIFSLITSIQYQVKNRLGSAMKFSTTILTMLISWALPIASPATFAAEAPRVLSKEQVSELDPLSIAQRYQIHSQHLGENRDFYVSLPKSYDDAQHHYPVMYLLDADQNMQHAVASSQMLAEWRGIPEMIIVGIPSTNRTRDYTPSRDAAYSEHSGGGDAFIGFIKEELAPYIDANYRAHPFRILTGHSLSGLIAANELVNASVAFQAYIIIAPSLWWHDFEILESAEQKFNQYPQQNTAVYFGIGELDGYGMKQELLRFTSAIDNANSDNIRYDHHEYKSEGHMSAPMAVTYDGLLSIFSDIPYSQMEWNDFSSDAFIAREQRLQDKYGSTAVQTAENYVALANYLLEQGNFNGAATVFKANVKTNPDFAAYYDWLANAYVLAGDMTAARKAYQQAYDLTVSSVTGQGNADQYLQQIALLDHPIDIIESEQQRITGCYINDDSEQYLFYQKGGKVYGQHADWQDFELFAKPGDQYFMRVPPRRSFRFVEEGSEMTLIVESWDSQSRFIARENDCQ